MSSIEFSAPWGKLLWAFTVMGCLIFSSFIGAILIDGSAPNSLKATLIGIGVFIFGFCALGAVRGYRIEQDAVVVRRLLWETRISLNGLDSVEHDEDLIKGALRIGNGGIFVFSGWFWSRRLGWFRLYGNDILGRAVIFSVNGKSWMVTPGQPLTFVEELKKKIG